MQRIPATTYVSSYYYVFVLRLLYMCPHTTIFVLILLYMCPHTAIYAGDAGDATYSCYYICVLRLLNVSVCYYICVLELLYRKEVIWQEEMEVGNRGCGVC